MNQKTFDRQQQIFQAYSSVDTYPKENSRPTVIAATVSRSNDFKIRQLKESMLRSKYQTDLSRFKEEK